MILALLIPLSFPKGRLSSAAAVVEVFLLPVAMAARPPDTCPPVYVAGEADTRPRT